MNKYEMFIFKFLYFDDLVRSNKGFDDIAFQEVCESLKELGPLFRESNSVPLDVANIFIDMYSSIESSADRHSPEMREKILLAADALADIAREITCESID